jgi:hypothetical protein
LTCRERCGTLFIVSGSKITRRMKENLTQQMLDAYLRSYLTDKDYQSAHHFDGIDWTNYGAPFKGVSKGRHTSIGKGTHNLWHVVVTHEQYYGGKKCVVCVTVKQRTGDTS